MQINPPCNKPFNTTDDNAIRRFQLYSINIRTFDQHLLDPIITTIIDVAGLAGLLVFYILVTCKVISRWADTCL